MHASVHTERVCTLHACELEEPEGNREPATGPHGRVDVLFSTFFQQKILAENGIKKKDELNSTRRQDKSRI